MVEDTYIANILRRGDEAIGAGHCGQEAERDATGLRRCRWRRSNDNAADTADFGGQAGSVRGRSRAFTNIDPAKLRTS